jgi:hypothetical protein
MRVRPVVHSTVMDSVSMSRPLYLPDRFAVTGTDVSQTPGWKKKKNKGKEKGKFARQVVRAQWAAIERDRSNTGLDPRGPSAFFQREIFD